MRINDHLPPVPPLERTVDPEAVALMMAMQGIVLDMYGLRRHPIPHDLPKRTGIPAIDAYTYDYYPGKYFKEKA